MTKVSAYVKLLAANVDGADLIVLTDFSDQSMAVTVSNKALTSNVATLTTSAAHGFTAGTAITVAGVDATFNGVYTIASAPTSTTLTYAKTAGNVTSTAATGTVSAGTTKTMTVDEFRKFMNSPILLDAISDPVAPGAGQLKLYAKTIAGRTVPKVVGPSGIDTPLQNALWQNNVVLWTPTTATAGLWQGTVGAGAGTYTTQLPTTTNTYTSQRRARWANVVTTTNQVLGQRGTEAMFFRGSAAGQGGFFFYARLGFDVWTNGGRFFAGMHTGTTVVSADPSALNNTVGFCVDAADNGAISFLTRSTSATKASTGFTIVSNKGYDVTIFCAPNSSQYTWRIVDIAAGTDASGTATATLPTNTTMQTPGVLASNAALTTVTAVQLGLNRMYVETDV